MIQIQLGQKIKVPQYNNEQRELWVDPECPPYTGIMAAVNGIAFKQFGCFIDRLSKKDKDKCFAKAAKIGLAWFEMPT